MAWIESHSTLARHPKTLRLARRLGVSVPTAIGHLHLLWWWALEFAESGDLSVYEPDDIADACEWKGDGRQFWEALIEVRFLDACGAIHDWYEYAGRLLEQRALHNKRTIRNRTLYADMELVRHVRTRDGDDCRYCGREVVWNDRKSEAGGTYDHVDPEGPNSPENVVVACRGCNSGKGRRTPEQAGKRLLDPPAKQVPGRLSAGNLPTVPNPTVPTLSSTKKAAPDAPAPDATPAPSSEQLRLRLPKAQTTDAVRAANTVLGKRCNEAERAAINAGVPATPPAQQLWESVLTAWKLRYERNKGLEGPLEWFAAGGAPAKRVNGAPQGGQYVQPITQQRNPGPAPLREPTPEEQAASEAEKARVRRQLEERHLAGRVARIGGPG